MEREERERASSLTSSAEGLQEQHLHLSEPAPPHVDHHASTRDLSAFPIPAALTEGIVKDPSDVGLLHTPPRSAGTNDNDSNGQSHGTPSSPPARKSAPPPPIRERTTTPNNTTCITNGPIRRGRGGAFTPDEGLHLAKAWVEVSHRGTDSDKTMWSTIEHICTTKYAMSRTADSLRCAWTRLARDSMNYSAAVAKVRELRTGGSSDDDVSLAAMNLYRQRAGRKDENGAVLPAAPFKYIRAAEFLRNQPKFLNSMNEKGAVPFLSPSRELTPSRKNGSSATPHANGMPTDLRTSFAREGNPLPAANSIPLATMNTALAEEDEGSASGSDAPRARPLGAKKQREIELRNEREKTREKLLTAIRDEISEGNRLMAEANRDARESYYWECDLRLLQILPPDSDRHRTLMEEMMKARRKRVRNRAIEQSGHEHGNNGNTDVTDMEAVGRTDIVEGD